MASVWYSVWRNAPPCTVWHSFPLINSASSLETNLYSHKSGGFYFYSTDCIKCLWLDAFIALTWNTLLQKLQAWCWLPNGQWELAKIQSVSGEDVIICLLDGEVSTYLLSLESPLLSLCRLLLGRLTCIYICCHNQVVTVSTKDILPVNPNILEGVDDLLQLSYLNEPSVLHNLQHRYTCDKIYVSVVNEFCYWVLVDKWAVLISVILLTLIAICLTDQSRAYFGRYQSL